VQTPPKGTQPSCLRFYDAARKKGRDMQEIFNLSAIQLARRVRNRDISCVELLQAHLQRVQRLNPLINAVVVMQEEVALQRAREADAALARGECWGPLHGLPMTVKEAFDVAGLPTTWGFEKFRDNLATTNAITVQRLLDAGAVIYGKTNVPVALADWQSFNPIYGTSHNPWDVARSPGGSSGGSAAALAAGLSTLELGSDIGSSIRNPAHYCGVWGHKPTWGVLPSQGHQLPGDVCADNTDIGVVGPLARSAHDLTLAMDILAAPLSAYGPMGRVPVQWRDGGVPARQMRVAVMLDEPRSPVDDSVRGALERLVVFLRGQGVHVSTTAQPVKAQEAWEVGFPLLRSALSGHLSDAEFAAAQQAATQAAGPTTEIPAAHWRALAMTHRDWHRFEERRSTLRQQWAAFFEQWDVFITPIAATGAVLHSQQGYRWERKIAVNGGEIAQTTQTFWAIHSGAMGLPSTAVPLELSAQVIGPAFGDPLCLRMARWLELEYRGFVAPPMARD
jgi:amidase